jgi:hypothetical protein
MPPQSSMAASSSSGAYEPAAAAAAVLRVTTYNVGITGDLDKVGPKIGLNLKELAEDTDIVFLQELGPWDNSIPQDPARQRVRCRFAWQ